MKNLRIERIVLVVFGTIGTVIGIALLFFPILFESSAGIELNNKISLLSEIRAYGGVILTSGIVIVMGAFISKLTYSSLAFSSLLYLAIGFSRIISIILDGIPAEVLVSATIAELFIGFTSLFLLFRMAKKKQIKPFIN